MLSTARAGRQVEMCIRDRAQAVFGFQYGIFRPAGFAIGGDAPPDDTLPLPPDGGVDDARPEGKFSFCNGVVELFHPLSQQRGGVAILGRQHEAAGVLVDADVYKRQAL